eukprot:gene31458-38852_t
MRGAPIHPTVDSSIPRASNGIADNYYREAQMDDESVDVIPPLRTDDLTDRDLYTNPALSCTKEYWQYTPPQRTHLEELIHRTPSTGSSPKASICSSRSSDPEDINDTVYQTQFKMGFRYYLHGAHISFKYSVGDIIIVECEKGEDLGVIVEIMSMQAYVDRARAGNHSLEEEEYKLRNILRMASMVERHRLQGKFIDEQVVAQYCADVTKNLFHLPMHIVDAEYQFDRSKLFIHYAANSRVDFRELIKNVFGTFKTCIWFKKLNRRVFEPKPFATIALRTGSMM